MDKQALPFRADEGLGGMVFKDDSGYGNIIRMSYAILLDFNNGCKFVSLFIDRCEDPLGVCVKMIQLVPEYLINQEKETESFVENVLEPGSRKSSLDLPFNNHIFIYSEDSMNQYILQANTPAQYQISMIFGTHIS